MVTRIVAYAMVFFLLNIGQAFSWSTEDGLGASQTLTDLKSAVGLWVTRDNPMGIDSNGYYVQTHPILTFKIIEVFEKRYGLELSATQKWEIIWGSIEEDWDVEGSSVNDCYANFKMNEDFDLLDEVALNRTVNHFIGPGNSPLEDLSDYASYRCDDTNVSSLEWAKNDIQNNYNFNNLQRNYFTDGAPSGWRTIGHILHLLEDCTSPAHVRNDAHIINDDNYETFAKQKDYSDESKTPLDYQGWMPTADMIPTEEFDSIDKYFDELSKLTRTNYFSDDTVFSWDAELIIGCSDSGNYFYNLRGKKIAYKDTAFKTAYAFYKKFNDKATAYELAKKLVRINKDVVKDGFPDLAANAIGYGAGLLKLCYEKIKENDNDLDGTTNQYDNDDDNDTHLDTEDAFPLDKTEWTDTDKDGIGNNADPDDDNDTHPDISDAFPFDKTEWEDTDRDGIGNNADRDDDNDGHPDVSDAFPLDKTEWADSDGDGIGDNADTVDNRIPANVHAEYQAAHLWNYITWDEVPGATEYRVYWGTEPFVTKTSELLTPTITTEYGHTGVVPGYTYYYRVAAVVGGAETELSQQVSAYVLGEASGKIPDTGQTASYTNTFGEDSDYTINPQSYTKLDASGNVLPDGATTWAMVKDNVTRLIWENKTDDGGIHDKDNYYTWDTAQSDFIAQMNNLKFGGFEDWRLPTVMELSMLVNANISYPGPTINTAYFQNTVSSCYWSSTTNASYPDYAWYVYFSYGYVSYGNKSPSLLYVRAVRGGQ